MFQAFQTLLSNNFYKRVILQKIFFTKQKLFKLKLKYQNILLSAIKTFLNKA